jgi:hypothetical protein
METAYVNRELLKPRPISITNSEYQELLNRISEQNEIIKSIKAQCSICPEVISTRTIRNILKEIR